DYLTNYIDTQAWQPRNIVFVNKQAFDKLTPAEQKAVKDAAAVAEERGWKLSVEEMTIKTAALKAAGIKVTAPTREFKAGLTKVGTTITAEWEKAAGADGAAMLAAYRK
ncbi:MAG: C4-dicarboxylate ABC transporter substrate-binding protein, partial [Pseudolabrys sp.]